MSSMSAQAHDAASVDSAVSMNPAHVNHVDGAMDQVKIIGHVEKNKLVIPDRPSSMKHRITDERVMFAADVNYDAKPRPTPYSNGNANGSDPTSPTAMNDTPVTTAPNSPNMLVKHECTSACIVRLEGSQTDKSIASLPKRTNSNESVKIRVKHPTTLDIPGLTKSTVSPDGKIAQRDLGSKLVIVMVGLPARGKSYITKKMTRYLNWLQHSTRIFNVGDRRRVAAGSSFSRPVSQHARGSSAGSAREAFRQQYLPNGDQEHMDAPTRAAHILLNGGSAIAGSPEETKDNDSAKSMQVPELRLPGPADVNGDDGAEEDQEGMDQSAAFFDPHNTKASQIREQVAMEALDELLEFIMNGEGAVGILDATNSTRERRQKVLNRIREKAGPDVNVLFLESVCVDDNLLERNIRLKLSGPDYKDKDPDASLADFKERIKVYEKSYVPIGDWEEKNNISYVQMIDVGRKVVSYKIEGFLSSTVVHYLLNFNLAPRQIWLTRHGESQDNLTGRLGGDSALTEAGKAYGRDLAAFIRKERREWTIRELDRHRQSHLPPSAGDVTPPNPHCADEDQISEKHFCVWTSMLQRSSGTAEAFDEAEFDRKEMRMLNEINAGKFEGFTYEEIKEQDRASFDERRKDKLKYRYPGPGGEGYLDVINRVKPVIVELERMTDHCLLIAHRSIVRIMLAYFRGLGRDDVTDLDVPLGMLYCLEPVSQYH